ncbi:MAG: hypothetical protein AAF393_05580 [Pseudomonadota bacterium]
MTPPFSFSDVTASVFPLRASLPTLDSFCRNYLNQAPHMVQFRPFMPYVYLIILDYGRMSLEAANLGWVSQREVAFGVPLRWMTAGEHGPEFYDWAFTCPFIFVDNELSMSTGREVYGWPKLLARLDPSVSEWVHNPHGSRRVFQVSTKGAKEAYVGETSSYQPLLSVHQHRTAGLLDIPPNLDAVLKPLGQLSGTLTSMSRLSVDLTKTFLGMASEGITGSSVLPDMLDQDTLRRQLEPDALKRWTSAKDWAPGVKDMLWSLFPRLYANTINFKQFRDAANPEATCYQAITAARMPIQSVKEGGFLGPQNMMLGQINGGFTIDIHHIAGLPIVESLGLEVAKERRTGGMTVSTLAPVCPLWMKADMTYGLADTVIWRGRDSLPNGGWRAGNVLQTAQDTLARRHAKPEVVTDDKAAQSTQDTKTPDAQPETGEDFDDSTGFDYIQAMNFFNTARGASEAVGGSFSMPDASVRVLPLKADAATLQKFVRDYLRIEGKMRFEAWGDFVYLVISDFNQMNSEMSGMAKRRAREMSLRVPVKCYSWFGDTEYPQSGTLDRAAADLSTREAKGSEHLLTTGFVNAFTYVDDVETAITANEVFGVPASGSRIISCDNDWLSHDYSGELEDQNLLEMTSQVLPELMVGAEAVDRRLIELASQRHHGGNVQESKSETVARWVETLADDLETKLFEDSRLPAPKSKLEKAQRETRQEAMCAAQGFALKLLGGDLSLNQFALKQFRDSHESTAACYQGLVLRRHEIQKLKDFREIEDPVTVSITDYPTQPICKLLGLIPKYSYPGEDKIVRVFEAARPFSLNADLRRGSGVTLYERLGGSPDWKQIDLTPQLCGWREVKRDQIADLVEKAAEPMALAYTHKEAGSDMVSEKRMTRADRHYLRSWFAKRVQAGEVSRVLVGNRAHPGSVSVLANDADFAAYDESNNRDIASWSAQMSDKETSFSQADIGRGMELYSPATVLDKILSRQWGKGGSLLPLSERKSDFCAPVTTVPSDTADRLFPSNERLGRYWPVSERADAAQAKRRRDEVVAFKSNLRNAVSTLAIYFPAQLLEATKPTSAKDWTVDAALDWLSQELANFAGGDPGKALQKRLRALVRGFADLDDADKAGTAAEAIVLEFVDLHLPDAFKMIPIKKTSAKAKKGQVFARAAAVFDRADQQEIAADDWQGLANALEDIRNKLALDHLDEPQEVHIVDILDPIIKRARKNQQEMALVEKSAGDAEAMGGTSALDAPHVVLRQRLRQIMTAPDETEDA